MSTDKDQEMARKGYHISLVIAGTMILWVLLSLIVGPTLGLPGRFALLFDLVALAALIYAGVNIAQLRRMHRDSKG